VSTNKVSVSYLQVSFSYFPLAITAVSSATLHQCNKTVQWRYAATQMLGPLNPAATTDPPAA
jgi:hypothetical protein